MSKRKKHAKKYSQTEGKNTKNKTNSQCELKLSLYHAFSQWWIRALVGAFPIALVGLIVAMATSTEVKAAAITVACIGTLALWAICVEIWRYSGEDETEYHGLLQPADEPMPNNPCRKIPGNALAIFLGRCAAYSSASPHAVIRIRGEAVLSFERVHGEIAINAKVFSRDGRIVAEIRRNEFFINPNNYFRRERPDSHSLIVFDQENRRVLDVRFINPRAVRFLGIFNHPDHEVVISETIGFFATNTICFGENGTDVAF
jgi:hypothetical protein